MKHDLKAGIYGEARCTVCIHCGSLWWTPYPTEDQIATYFPKECEREDGPPVGVYIMMNDAGGRMWRMIANQVTTQKPAEEKT